MPVEFQDTPPAPDIPNPDGTTRGASHRQPTIGCQGNATGAAAAFLGPLEGTPAVPGHEIPDQESTGGVDRHGNPPRCLDRAAPYAVGVPNQNFPTKSAANVPNADLTVQPGRYGDCTVRGERNATYQIGVTV